MNRKLFSVDEEARGQHCKKDDQKSKWLVESERIQNTCLAIFSPFILRQYTCNPAPVPLRPIIANRSNNILILAHESSEVQSSQYRHPLAHQNCHLFGAKSRQPRAAVLRHINKSYNSQLNPHRHE
jgi:hypothetical protein